MQGRVRPIRAKRTIARKREAHTVRPTKNTKNLRFKLLNRAIDVWNLFVAAFYLGYVGKFFSESEAPLQKLTIYSLALNGVWRLNLYGGKCVIAATSSIGICMVVVYWISIYIYGMNGFFGDDRYVDIQYFDLLDDLLVHAIFPLEAFIVALLKKVYDTYDSIVELLLFALLYIPLFISYRPYPLLKELSLAEVTGISFIVLCVAVVFHIIMIFTTQSIISRFKKLEKEVKELQPLDALKKIKIPRLKRSS